MEIRMTLLSNLERKSEKETTKTKKVWRLKPYPIPRPHRTFHQRVCHTKIQYEPTNMLSLVPSKQINE